MGSPWVGSGRVQEAGVGSGQDLCEPGRVRSQTLNPRAILCCSLPWRELWSGDVPCIMSGAVPRHIATRCLLRSHETWSMRPSWLWIRRLLR